MGRQALGILTFLTLIAGIPLLQERVACSECGTVQSASNRFCENCGKPMEHFKFLELMGKAKDLASRNDHRGAAATYIQAASRKVGNMYKALALLGAGKCYFELKEYAEATKELSKSLTFDAGSYEANLILGRIELEVNKNLPKAKEYFLAANRLSGDESTAALWLADIALDNKELAEALKLYQIAEQKYPEIARIPYLIAVIMDSSGGAFADIEAKLKRARELNPNWIDPPLLLAQRLMRQERYADAAIYFGICYDLRPTDASFGMRAANAFRLAKDIPGARVLLEKVLRRHPRHLPALIGLARIALIHDNDLKAAQGYLERARAIDPNDAEVEFMHGLVVDLNDKRKEVPLVVEFNCDRAMTWGPTGTSFAFQSDRSKSWHIYSMKIGGAPIQLTTKGANADPSFSPDGSKIAFHSNRGRTQIFVMDANGKNEKQLTDAPGRNESPSWSPDGRQIVFMSTRANASNFDLYVMNFDGSNVRRLTNSPGPDLNPKFSPDGQTIVYTSEQGDNRDIFTVSVDGGAPKRLTNDKANNDWPSYSPNGKFILFSSKASGHYRLMVMRADGSAKILVGGGSGDLDEMEGAWNPNGVRIACTVGKLGSETTYNLKSYIAPIGNDPIVWKERQ